MASKFLEAKSEIDKACALLSVSSAGQYLYVSSLQIYCEPNKPGMFQLRTYYSLGSAVTLEKNNMCVTHVTILSATK
jgi:hypothetical protein